MTSQITKVREEPFGLAEVDELLSEWRACPESLALRESLAEWVHLFEVCSELFEERAPASDKFSREGDSPEATEPRRKFFSCPCWV